VEEWKNTCAEFADARCGEKQIAELVSFKQASVQAEDLLV
jgi:hypothetical protein